MGLHILLACVFHASCAQAFRTKIFLSPDLSPLAGKQLRRYPSNRRSLPLPSMSVTESAPEPREILRVLLSTRSSPKSKQLQLQQLSRLRQDRPVDYEAALTGMLAEVDSAEGEPLLEFS